MQLGAALGVNGQRVGTNDLFERRFFDTLAGIAAEHTVCDNCSDGFGTAFSHHLGSLAERSCRVGDVVKEYDILAIYITQDAYLRHFVEVRPVLIANDHRHFAVGHCVQFLGEIGRPFGTSDIGRSDYQFLEIEVRYIRREHIGTVDMVHGNIEESLNLVGMQVHGDDTVRTGCLQHIRHQFGTDGYTRFVLAVLPCPAEIRDDGNDLGSTGPLGGIDHQEQFHQVVAGRTGGLHEIDRLPANGLLEIGAELAVGEAVDTQVAYLAAQFFTDALRKRFAFGSCENLVLLGFFHIHSGC